METTSGGRGGGEGGGDNGGGDGGGEGGAGGTVTLATVDRRNRMSLLQAVVVPEENAYSSTSSFPTVISPVASYHGTQSCRVAAQRRLPPEHCARSTPPLWTVTVLPMLARLPLTPTHRMYWSFNGSKLSKVTVPVHIPREQPAGMLCITSTPGANGGGLGGGGDGGGGEGGIGGGGGAFTAEADDSSKSTSDGHSDGNVYEENS
eukprot:scaffold845_cov364-Prasinococcus_capsulatus_cf.AAC.8